MFDEDEWNHLIDENRGEKGSRRKLKIKMKFEQERMSR